MVAALVRVFSHLFSDAHARPRILADGDLCKKVLGLTVQVCGHCLCSGVCVRVCAGAWVRVRAPSEAAVAALAIAVTVCDEQLIWHM